MGTGGDGGAWDGGAWDGGDRRGRWRLEQIALGRDGWRLGDVRGQGYAPEVEGNPWSFRIEPKKPNWILG
jgi:hypothetical protein